MFFRFIQANTSLHDLIPEKEIKEIKKAELHQQDGVFGQSWNITGCLNNPKQIIMEIGPRGYIYNSRVNL